MHMQKLLIIPQNWLGDIVMSQTLLKRVKLENPDTKIDILVNSTFKSLVERMPEINKAIILDCEHKELGFFKRLSLAKKIKGNYDQSIVLSRSIKSAFLYKGSICIIETELDTMQPSITFNPFSFKANASCKEIADFPTPPLAENIPIMLLTFLSVSGILNLLSG